MSKQPQPAPTASAVGPCPTIIQISRTPRHWKFTQHHHTTRQSPAKQNKSESRLDSRYSGEHIARDHILTDMQHVDLGLIIKFQITAFLEFYAQGHILTDMTTYRYWLDHQVPEYSISRILCSMPYTHRHDNI